MKPSNSNPKEFSYIITLGTLLNIIVVSTANEYYDEGLEHAYHDRYSAAIKAYDKSIELNSNNPEVYASRGSVKSALEQHLSAIKDFDTAIRLKPNDSYAYLCRGDAKRGLGKYFDAITDYDTAIRLDPDDCLAYNARAMTKADLEQYREAIKDHNIAIRYLIRDIEQMAPSEHRTSRMEYLAEIYSNRGNAKARTDKPYQAINDYNMSIKAYSKYARAYYNRGVEWYYLGKTSKAKTDLLSAVHYAKQTGDTRVQIRAENFIQENLH